MEKYSLEKERDLELRRFLREHPSDWEEVLSSEPYCLEIKRDEVFGRRLVLFKYSQIGSDFSLGLVRECRGLVLEEGTWEPVVVPFFKFFNHSEKWADSIDWGTAKVTQKLDGSIIKVVKMESGDLLVGTNSNIDAFKAPLASQVGCPVSTFGDLVLEGLKPYGLTEEGFAALLDPGKTYIFELTSPWTQVVVRWPETRLNFIGVRDNVTLREERYEDHPLAGIFNVPKIYPLENLSQCLRETAKMGDDEEGFVVRDGDFHRIKVKSETYLRLHRLAGNGVLSLDRAVEIVKMNETSEIVSYFPHFERSLRDVEVRFEKLLNSLETSWEGFMTLVTPMAPRKEAAAWILKNFDLPGFGFAMLDGKVGSAREFVEKMTVRNVVRALGYKDEEIRKNEVQ